MTCNKLSCVILEESEISRMSVRRVIMMDVVFCSSNHGNTCYLHLLGGVRFHFGSVPAWLSAL